MTHLHVPDGVLPLWLWAAGWALAFAGVAAAGVWLGRADRARRLPLLGAVSALVLVGMSLEIVPLAYHLNLTVVAGALLGPAPAIVSAFVVSTILALLGHGGVTVIGINSLVLGAEMVLGWALFRGMVRIFGRGRIFVAGAASTIVTLAVTTSLLVGVVALAGISEMPRPEGILAPEHEAGAVVSTGDDEHGHEDGLSVTRFATVVFVLGPIGWIIEALVTGGMLGFVGRVRPGLLFDGAAGPVRPPPGDEHGEP